MFSNSSCILITNRSDSGDLRWRLRSFIINKCSDDIDVDVSWTIPELAIQIHTIFPLHTENESLIYLFHFKRT